MDAACLTYEGINFEVETFPPTKDDVWVLGKHYNIDEGKNHSYSLFSRNKFSTNCELKFLGLCFCSFVLFPILKILKYFFFTIAFYFLSSLVSVNFLIISREIVLSTAFSTNIQI